MYQQKAAEYRALAYQAFNLARLLLDADLEKKNVKKLPKAERKMPRAIVVDIDETVLDNSPAQVYGIKNGAAFNTKDWYAWGEMRKARAVPGSVEFLNYAVAKGVKATILGLLGRPYETMFFGRDLLGGSPADSRAVLNHNRSIGLYRENRLVVLGLKQGVEFYAGDPKREDIKPVAAPDAADLEQEKDTIALFQVADDLYTHERYRIDSPTNNATTK